MTAATRRLAAVACCALLLPACSPDGEPATTTTGTLTEGAAGTPIGDAPSPGGAAGFGPLPAGMRPTAAPARAGPSLAGQALPTNQWWTSALAGPWKQPLWAHPLAVQPAGGGIAVSAAAATASADAVVTPFAPALTAGGPITATTVAGYGAFHVVLHCELRGGGSVEVTVVQGSPVLHLAFRGATPAVTATGPLRTLGEDGPLARLEVAGQRWDVLAQDGARWRADGTRLTLDRSDRGAIAVARVPDGADAARWEQALAGAAGDPVTRTTAHMAYDPTGGAVTQTLTAQRRSGKPSLWALMPHQQRYLTPDGSRALAGRYADARGTLAVRQGGDLRIRVPMPGLLTAAPAVPLSGPARAAVVQDLDRDLADTPPSATGGSYFGLKELGRLATVAEVAAGAGAADRRAAALRRLRAGLTDWLTYDGPGDGHFFGYDRTWGGLIAVPAEFGAGDYNDHHFQYGYLVRAAAVLAAADPGFRRDYGGAVTLVARDYAGGGPGLPPFRSFNAYLGHSAASGFAPFADGNNQESSSEAVAAWEAVARWGLVTGDAALTAHGITHYALEAATARMYWLGDGLDRPAGYRHTVAGIVWDAKLDHATWFDPKVESVVGIQLLPLTFGSLYRAAPGPAAARAAEVGAAPRVWGDLFAADLAAADPAAARRRLSADPPREESTSRAMVRYWVEMLAAYGPPQPAVTADGPHGLAFGSAGHPRLIAVPPGKVTFRRADGTVAGTATG